MTRINTNVPAIRSINRMAVNQFENVVHGALKTYDLPDLLATLPKSKVTVVEPLDARELPIGSR